MVNQNNGKIYTPTPIYNRKMLRNIIRERAKEVNGYHKVSKFVHAAFDEIRNNIKNSEEN